MSSIHLGCGLLLLAGGFFQAFSQSPFVNLDFEASTLPISPSGVASVVPTSQAFPGWQAFIGATEQANVYLNLLPGGATAITLLNAYPPLGASAISGNFSLVLNQGNAPANTAESLSQIGLIPANAISIQAEVLDGFAAGDLFRFSLNGVPISMFQIGTTDHATLYGGDISQFAGQAANLSISVLPSQGFGYSTAFDSIVFSPMPVPEPSSTILMVLGSICTICYTYQVKCRPGVRS